MATTTNPRLTGLYVSRLTSTPPEMAGIFKALGALNSSHFNGATIDSLDARSDPPV